MADQSGNFGQGTAQIIGHAAGVVGPLGTGLHIVNGGGGFTLYAVDHAFKFFGGLLGTVGQGAYFVGAHGKTTARLTRAGGFDGGVQGQQVGLFGNGADNIQHLTNVFDVVGQHHNAVGGFFDFTHQFTDGVDGFFQLALAHAGFGIQLLRGGRGGAGAVGDFIHRHGQFVHRGGCLFQLRALLVHDFPGVVGGYAQFFRGGGQLMGRVGNMVDGFAQLVLHLVQGAHHISGFVFTLILNRLAEVAGGNPLGHCNGFLQRVYYAAAEQNGKHSNGGQRYNDGSVNAERGTGADFLSFVYGALGGCAFVCRQLIKITGNADRQRADFIFTQLFGGFCFATGLQVQPFNQNAVVFLFVFVNFIQQ